VLLFCLPVRLSACFGLGGRDNAATRMRANGEGVHKCSLGPPRQRARATTEKPVTLIFNPEILQP
jgi:hypothetical protein